MDMDLSRTLKQIIITVAALGVIAFGIGLFFVGSVLYWLLGIALGTVVSVIKVILLEKTLNKAVDMSPEDAKNYTKSRYTLRLVLSVVLIVVAFKIPCFDVIGVIVGLLLIQPAVYIVNFINRKNK